MSKIVRSSKSAPERSLWVPREADLGAMHPLGAKVPAVVNVECVNATLRYLYRGPLEAVRPFDDVEHICHSHVSEGTPWTDTKVASVEEVLQRAYTLRGANQYVNVSTYTEQRGRTKRQALRTLGLCADWDVKSEGHPDSPLTLEAAKAAIETLTEAGLPPTVIGWSGWGLQTWWLLPERVDLDRVDATDDDCEPLRRTFKRLVDPLGADPAVSGDAVRPMRLLGTVNYRRRKEAGEWLVLPPQASYLISAGDYYTSVEDLDARVRAAKDALHGDVDEAPRKAPKKATRKRSQPVREDVPVLGDTWTVDGLEGSGMLPGAVFNRLHTQEVFSVDDYVIPALLELGCVESFRTEREVRLLAPESTSGQPGVLVNLHTEGDPEEEDLLHKAGTVTNFGSSWEVIGEASAPFTVYAIAHHLGATGDVDWGAAAQDVATIPEVQECLAEAQEEAALENALATVTHAEEESEESEDSSSDDLIPRPLPMSLWGEHPVLQTIYDSAAHANVPAESVLGAALMLTSYAVPWNLVMDPSATNPKSLAVHVAIVGDSSAGKNKGYGVARRLLRMENPEDDSHTPWPTPNSLGSGEGLTELFYGDEASQMPNPDYSETAKKGTRNSYKFLKVPGFHRHEAMLWDGEMDAVTKRMVERAGSTLDGELRKATHGEGLGQTNVKARLLPEMSYKLVHGMAGQEHSAQKLTQGEALGGGLTSRYLFVNPRVSNCAVPREGSTFDPRTTCVTIAPPTPSMLRREANKGRLFHDLQAPPGVMHGGAPYSWDLYTIRLHPDTHAMWMADEEEKVRRAKAREARGIAGLLEDDGEPDKHLLFKRLKVAYVLGVLCEGTSEAWTCVLPRWYKVAGVVMEHHSQTIRYLQTFAEAKANKALRDKAVMELGARTHARERFTDEQLLKGAKVIARKVAHYGDEGCSARDAYATLPGRLKKKDMPQKADYLTYAAEQGWATMRAEGDSVWVTITEAGLQAIS